jgi:hypothetical protein
LVFHTRPVRRLLFRCSLSAADWTNESQQAPEHKDKSRIISHVSIAARLIIIRDFVLGT